MTHPTRPVVRWHGGKWRLAPWIIEHMPPHRVYVECYGGGGSVLLRKPRAYAEVYNDLDGEIVTLFRVLRDPAQAARLVELCRLTPFARAEFEQSYEATDDPVERARRLVARSFMGFGSDGHNGDSKTGFRANSNRSGTTPSRDWMNWPDAMAPVIERLRGVVIERRRALEVMTQHDSIGTLHYVDPPYLHETRRPGMGANYRHEMTAAQHAELLTHLQGLKGMVLLSGYRHPLYDEALTGWQRIDRAAYADGARKRTECLWLNPAAQAPQRQPRLGEVA